MSPGVLLYISLIYVVLIQQAQCCVPSTIQAQVPVEVQAGYVVSKVNVGDCNSRRFYFSTCDPDFTVLPDGTIVTLRVTRVTSEGKSFCVWAQDQTHHRWKVDVTLTHTMQPQLPQQKTGVLRRFRRRWSPPPIYLQENSPPPYPKDLEQIGSDSSQNQSVYYRISGPGVTTHPVGVFSCEELSGVLRVHRALDREEFPVLIFIAHAYNRITHKETDKPLPITVNMEDVNDNAPEFVENSLLFTVEERSKVGTVVGQINATDKDEPNTSHTKIRYILLTGTELFSVHSFSGVISTKSATLDRETQEKHLVTVEIRDMGGALNGLSNTGTATISLTDINDNPPTFSEKSYKARVGENKADVLVLRIPVEDKDLKGTANWKVIFKITKGNENGYFRVDTDPETNEGLLYVTKPLDHEEGSHLMLELVAENEAPLVGAGAWMQVPVDLMVGDEDEGPVFSPPILTLRVKENVPNGTLIGTYTATDPETKTGKGIKYYEETDPASWISVDENTGGLKTTNMIDRESKFVSNGMYNMTVRAVDTSKKQGIGTVLILIDDVNDNNPVITVPDRTLCEQDGVLGSITLHAEDADATPYGEPFTFELGEEAVGKWKLKDAKGTSVVLQQAVALPYGLYSVPVVVKDLQGVGEAQTVNVRLCECATTTPGQEECVAQERSAVLGTWGVLAILLALALLLLLLLLFVFICSTKREKLYIDDGSGGMLIKSNTEAPGEEVKTDPFLLLCPSPVEAVDTQSRGQGVGLGGGLDQQTLEHQHQYQGNGFQTSAHEFVTSGGQTNIYASGHYGQGFYGDEGFQNYSVLDTWRTNELYLGNKLMYFCEEEDGRYADDLLKDYGYEGEGSSVGSLDCLSQMGVEEDSLDFLDALGPKFRLLAHTCTHTAEEEE